MYLPTNFVFVGILAHLHSNVFLAYKSRDLVPVLMVPPASYPARAVIQRGPIQLDK